MPSLKKPTYTLLSIQRIDNKTKDTKSVKNVAKFKYLGMVLTKQTACTKKASAE